jgi:hypothetical protein
VLNRSKRFIVKSDGEAESLVVLAHRATDFQSAPTILSIVNMSDRSINDSGIRFIRRLGNLCWQAARTHVVGEVSI